MEDQDFNNQEVRVYIRQLGTPANATPTINIVELEDDRGRTLRISIGVCEAMSILRKLEEDEAVSYPIEPHAHDLLLEICNTFNASLEKVVIDDLWHRTYYAKLYLQTPTGLLTIDARPSDAMPFALRANAPIFALESVLIASERSQEGESEEEECMGE
jgi:uncharacterized protein